MLLPSVFTNDFTNDDFFDDFFNAPARRSYMPTASMKCDVKYIRKECFTGSCQRSFYVGDAVKGEDIGAAFNNGILSLTVPKAEALPQNETKQLVHIEG